MLRFFIKIYADDFKSASSTIPLALKGDVQELTIRDLKEEIEKKIEPSIKMKN